MGSTHRTSSYSLEEDVHLCHVYLGISQNTFINHSKGQFWARVETEYHSEPKFKNQSRPRRSLQSRMTVILSAITKLKGCIQQIENLDSTGVSVQDVLTRAKILLAQDSNYKRGFKFDHVWPILKDIAKFGNNNVGRSRCRSQWQSGNFVSSQSDSPSVESLPSSSPRLLNDEKLGATSTEVTTVGKKAKGERKNEEQLTELIIQQNKQLVEILKNGNSDFQQNYELQKRKLAVAEYKEENKILFKDLNSISDLNLREFIHSEQIRIMRKRSQAWGSQLFQQGEGSQVQRSQD